MKRRNKKTPPLATPAKPVNAETKNLEMPNNLATPVKEPAEPAAKTCTTASKVRRRRKVHVDVYKGKRVTFLDIRKGFWRTGTCYKETDKLFWVRDILNHRYRVNLGNIMLLETEISQTNETKS